MAASVLGEAFASDRFAGVKRPFGETFPPIATPPIANLTGRAKADTRFSPIYPGFALGCTIDAMWFIESDPVGPGRMKYAIGGCFPRGTAARGDFDASSPGYFERWETAMREDNDALERQHKGPLSPCAMPGRIQTARESIVPILGRWVAERVIANA